MRAFYPIFLLMAHVALAQKTVQVKSNRNVEIINLLAVQNTPNLLKDTLTNPWLKENSILMRRSFLQFSHVRQQAIFQTYQRLEDKLGTGTYLLGLYYSEVPQARRQTDIPVIITEAVSSNRDSVLRAFDEFFGQLNGLYRDVGFGQFLAQNQYVYQKALAEVAKNLPATEFIPMLERYYGTTKRSYNILINPFFQTAWGMGWEVNDNGGTDIFNISSPVTKAILEEDGRVVSPGFDNRVEIRRLSVHEFGHSFINPLANQPGYKAQIEQFNRLYEPIEGDEQYHDWHTQFCEYVVRAGEIRLALVMNNVTDAKAVREQNAKWRYLAHFIDQLEYYEQNRPLYPTFASFFPTLVGSLAALKK